MSDDVYGCRKVIAGKHKGRIACVDDDGDRADHVIVFFGDVYSAATFHTVKRKSVARASVKDLIDRRTAICGKLRTCYSPAVMDPFDRADILGELVLIESELGGRMLAARNGDGDGDGTGVFISHSSVDKFAARWMGVELAQDGYRTWLDEWRICVGESIPTAISDGIQECEFLVILLSKHAVESGWVEREWQAAYWHEVTSGRTRVLPVLLEDCQIPTLLLPKSMLTFAAITTKVFNSCCSHCNGCGQAKVLIDNWFIANGTL